MENEEDSLPPAQVNKDNIAGGQSLTPTKDAVPQMTSQTIHAMSGGQQHGSVHTGTSPYDMNNMASALPEYGYRMGPHQMYPHHMLPHGSSPAIMYPQFPGPAPGYHMPYAQQPPMQNYAGQRPYAPYKVHQSSQAIPPIFTGQPYYAQPQMMPNLPPNSFTQSTAFVPSAGAGYGTQSAALTSNTMNYGQAGSGMQFYQPADMQGVRRSSSNSSLQTSVTIRGPPRKPRQSGHALWVGNLPPGTNIIDLKDHFSRDAKDDIESVFLISKSNCAFVNYKSEEGCSAAMNRFHDSRFQGVRLVCRLRRGSAAAPGTAGSLPPGGANVDRVLVEQTEDVNSDQSEEAPAPLSGDNEPSRLESGGPRVKERFFIIKSLTIEDLERSVQNGIWATQSHNEAALNKAYQTADNVYLMFSANKSGEYFGYARMDSAIDDESAAAINISQAQSPPVQHQQESPSVADVPQTIPTPATATAPKGHIIDDSARGTIFWEAESTLPEDQVENSSTALVNLDAGNTSSEDTSASQPESPGKTTVGSSPSTTFGKPFRITWLSTDRLPFYRTRGLRNPWNTNREVKIARDGTELEPGIGRRLVDMFGTVSPSTQKQPLPGYPVIVGQPQAQRMPSLGHGPQYGRPY